MNDTILAARLAELERNLLPHDAPQSWQQTFSGAHVHEQIWWELGREMTFKRREQSLKVRDIKRELECATNDRALRRLWAKYSEVYEASQSIFRESREIMGGLAFREKALDASMCEIAEDIVLDCYRIAGTTVSLPLPGHDAVARTLARVVRMRLPEWTIWMLPLVAHEYGRVRLDDLPGLARLATDQVGRFASVNPTWRTELAANGSGRTQVLEAATPMLESLIADAFAALAMGPAYAYAAVTLALNPADTGFPPHTLRSEIIFTVLERIEEDDGSRPFAEDAAYLREQWEKLRSRVGRRQPAVPPLVGVIADAVVEDNALMSLRYREGGSDALGRPRTHGWRTAQDWADEWIEAVEAGRELPQPPVEFASRIHDVLNAAWLARLRATERSAAGAAALSPENSREASHVQAIEDAALELCRRVVAEHTARPDGRPRREGLPGDPR